MKDQIELRSAWNPALVALRAKTATKAGHVLLNVSLHGKDSAHIALGPDQRNELAAFLADPKPAAIKGDLRLPCAIAENPAQEFVDFHLDDDGDLRVEVSMDGSCDGAEPEVGHAYISPAGQAKLRRYLDGLPQESAKDAKEAEAATGPLRQAADDLRRIRSARVEDQSWPWMGSGAFARAKAVEMQGAREDTARERERQTMELFGPRVRSLSTKELIDEVLSRVGKARESATQRIGSTNREAGREYSLSITALEDAQMRFTRGLSKQKGVFKPLDLERVDAEKAREELEHAVVAQQHWGLGVFGRGRS